MVRRKGELSRGTIDRGWPHQVALPSYQCGGDNYLTHRYFCDGNNLNLCPRGHSFYRGNTDFSVFCFAEAAHAELFRARFGGELMCPKSRPKWPAG